MSQYPARFPSRRNAPHKIPVRQVSKARHARKREPVSMTVSLLLAPDRHNGANVLTDVFRAHLDNSSTLANMLLFLAAWVLVASRSSLPYRVPGYCGFSGASINSPLRVCHALQRSLAYYRPPAKERCPDSANARAVHLYIH